MSTPSPTSRRFAPGARDVSAWSARTRRAPGIEGKRGSSNYGHTTTTMYETNAPPFPPPPHPSKTPLINAQAMLEDSGWAVTHDESGDNTNSNDNDDDDNSSSIYKPLKTLVRNVGGCGGLAQALKLWSWQPSGGREGGVLAKGKGGGGGAPEWVPDDEEEACMLCGSM